MGSGQSVRATHFSRPQSPPPEEQDDPRISISNKMVERLVEDATLAGGAAAVAPMTRKPRDDLKDKILTEKIKCLDETHSERNKITVDDINSLARRIEMRASNLPGVDAVCPDFQQRVIDCYNDGAEAGDVVNCWNTIVSPIWQTSNLLGVDAVCPDFQQRVIDCYNDGVEAGDVVNCWNTIVSPIWQTSNLLGVDAVCPDFQQRVIDCYNDGAEAGDVVNCWNTIGEFSACVAAASAARLHRHSRQAAAAQARRDRGVALARLDLGASS